MKKMNPMKTICPIFYKSSADFLIEWDEMMHSSCDWIEVRLDRALQEEAAIDLAFLKNRKKPVLLTIRTKEEGGEVELSQEEYEQWIDLLLQHGDWVDVELTRFFPLSKNQREKVVLSYHDFETTPNDLAAIWQAMEEKECAIEKIAVMPKEKEDVVRLFLSCAQHPTKKEKIAISMGELGKISRVIGSLFDSSYTFASFQQASAPGQIELAYLQALLALVG